MFIIALIIVNFLTNTYNAVMIYYLAFFFVNSTFVIINPYLQVMLDNLGFGFEAVGIFIACFEGFGILGPLLIGHIANSKNWYKKTIIASLIISSLSFYFLSYVNSYIAVILLLITTGFFFRAIAPLLDSIGNAAVSGDSARYTKIRAAGTVGYVIISATLSLINRPILDSNKSIGLWLIIISFISVIIMFFVPKNDDLYVKMVKDNSNNNGNWFDKAFVICLILIGLNRFSLSGVCSFLSLYSIKEVGYTDLTTLNLVSTVAEFFVMIYSGHLLQEKKVKPVNMLIFGSLILTIRVLIYAFLPSVKFLLLGQTLHSVCYGSFHAASIVFINKHIRKDMSGVGISMYYALATSLPSVISSSIGGFIISNYNFTSLFLFYGVISMLSVLIGIIFYKTLNKEIEYSI
ncbi:MAG: MFS transporter [Pleomorphochaeta sp.]